MKILFYGINFSPEMIGIGKYMGEMASWFSTSGHDVRVITAPPYYPAWKVGEGYSARKYRKEKLCNLTVYRTPLWVPSKPRGVKRLFHLLSFAISSLPVLFAQWRWKPDVVWVVEPPLMCSPAAIAFARSIGAHSWLHIQDYEIDAAFDMGLLKGQCLRRWVQRGERWLMRRFDRISTISDSMLNLAKVKGSDESRLVLFPNWVDISSIKPLGSESSYRSELRLPLDSVVLLYSGNMGHKQGLDILSDCAHLLSFAQLGIKAPKVEFVFCGNGAGRADLEQRCVGLNNVHFLDLQPQERLNDLLGVADIHLLPQRADAADLVMPSKLTGMLASGRAVIATATLDTELGRIISQKANCGLIVPAEDASALARAILELVSDQPRRQKFGANGRMYAEKMLNKDVILRRFELELQRLIAKKA